MSGRVGVCPQVCVTQKSPSAGTGPCWFYFFPVQLALFRVRGGSAMIPSPLVAECFTGFVPTSCVQLPGAPSHGLHGPDGETCVSWDGQSLK